MSDAPRSEGARQPDAPTPMSQDDLFGPVPPPSGVSPYRVGAAPPDDVSFAPTSATLRERTDGSLVGGVVLGFFCGIIGLVYAVTRARPQTRVGVFIGLAAQVAVGLLGQSMRSR